MTKWRCPKCKQEGTFHKSISEVAHKCTYNKNKTTEWERVNEPD